MELDYHDHQLFEQVAGHFGLTIIDIPYTVLAIGSYCIEAHRPYPVWLKPDWREAELLSFPRATSAHLIAMVHRHHVVAMQPVFSLGERLYWVSEHLRGEWSIINLGTALLLMFDDSDDEAFYRLVWYGHNFGR